MFKLKELETLITKKVCKLCIFPGYVLIDNVSSFSYPDFLNYT